MSRKLSVHIGNEMEGKICVVTGASRGIGFYVARNLARRGAFIVLVSHNKKRGEKASRQIDGFVLKRSTDFMLADLSSQEQIRQFAETFKEKYDHLDVLVNNAGGLFLKRRESVDGMEMTFALNHLNYFMTTLLLMDHLLASDSARVVNVASEAHRGAQINFADLQFENGYNGRQAYNQSKLANLLFTYALARRLAETNTMVNAVHPGFVSTNLGKQNPAVRAVMDIVHAVFAKSPVKGAETPVYLASSPDVEGVTGKYFIKKEPVRSSEESYDTETAEKLWQMSEEFCDVHFSETKVNLVDHELVNG